ncbi:MAG: response regulator, partial [Halobacteriovoraceae bacterium]|nr:response regulator [Halobacteriovoraceae bacterium]
MKKILLIEDDEVMRENTAEILELANFTVGTAENGKVGVKLAKEFKPDLIVCDIMMPELDGYGVLHMLSRDPSSAAIPFIFLTAKAERSELRKGMELGADDYLTKPFEESELLNAIEARMRKADSIRQEFSQNMEGLNKFLDSAQGVDELKQLSDERKAVSYKKNQVIYHEDDRPGFLYFVAKGKVKTYRTNDEGKEFITNVFDEGSFFGLTPLFEDKAYSESALALEDGQIRKIPKEDFLALVFKNREVAARFIKMLSCNVDENERKLLSLAYSTVRKRTAEALVEMEKRFSVE